MEIINEKILKKIKDISDNADEFKMCKKILEYENSYLEGEDFKGDYEKFMKICFKIEDED